MKSDSMLLGASNQKDCWSMKDK